MRRPFLRPMLPSASPACPPRSASSPPATGSKCAGTGTSWEALLRRRGPQGTSQGPASGARVHPGNGLDAMWSPLSDLQRKVSLTREAHVKCQVRKEPDEEDERREPCRQRTTAPTALGEP